MDLKIAELRKKNKLTQQELGDMLSISYQTISKWENGVVLPDVTMLPKLSQCFGVSVDALLGLVPLDEDYRPSNSGTKDYWAGRVDYLKRTRKTMWNEDYLQFLVKEVWRIEQAVTILDCGCGYGAMGLVLLPLLPEGSKYVGIDFSEEMIAEAERLYEETDYDAEFVLTNVLDYSKPEKFDIVISQAMLRHVDGAEQFLQKMVEFLKPGGLLISMECNREFEADGLFINGLDYEYLCNHEGLKKLWATELKMQNRDYSIAMKIPHYMKKAGLVNIGTRMNDRVTYLEPEHEHYEQMIRDIAKADHWANEKTGEEMQQDMEYFMNHGMSYAEAEDYCRQQKTIVDYLSNHIGEVSLTQVGGVMISYGWKRRQ